MADNRVFPDVEFIHKSADEIMTEMVNDWESDMGRSLGMADPVRLMLGWEAMINAQLYAAINETGKLNVPRYAYGEYLDSIAEKYYYGLSRMQATAATTTMRFSLSQASEYDIAVPAGTRVTQNGDVLFQVLDTVYIKAGETYLDVPVECMQTGTAGNGYAAGTIKTCVDGDNVENLASVANITESEGGSAQETDEAFYERMRESMGAYSTAGPSESYIYHAKSANVNVGGVEVVSPERGYVDVYILRTDGQIPGEELLQEVQDYLSQNHIRIMTDYVTVKAPEIVSFDIDITWYRESGAEKSREQMEAEIEAALTEYQEWQTTEIGKDINPSYLTKLLMGTAVKRVEVRSPAFTAVGKNQVAQIGIITVTCGGDEDA